MIKIKSIITEDYNTPGVDDGKTILVSLVADAKEEVIALGNDASSLTGHPDTFAFGSTCLTVTKDFGILDSTGNWNF